jgi:alpha-glucosidase
MADFGYDVADYCDVDPIFGNLSDMDELIKEAHKHNIKIMVDLGTKPFF